MKIIFHIDMDAYFVSAHQAMIPKLLNKPVVISTNKTFSIITAASYDAKKLGIYVPMPLYKAKQLVKNLVVVEPRYNLYTHLSAKLFNLLALKYTEKLEIGSIDECYMDVSQIWKNYGSPYKLAQHIQSTIFSNLKLHCSIGIGINKYIAKMASPLNKPQGISIIKPSEFEKIIWPMPIENSIGIGKSSQKSLNLKGIHTIGDLAKFNVQELISTFGKKGQEWWLKANGKSEDRLNYETNALKSIGNSITFEKKDQENYEELHDIVKQLSTLVSIRTQARNLKGYVVNVGVKVFNDDINSYEIKHKQIKLSTPIDQYELIFQHSLKLFNSLWKKTAIKLISVSLTKLSNIFQDSVQMSLFDQPKNFNKTQDIIKQVNLQLKTNVLTSASEKLHCVKKKYYQTRYLLGNE